MNTVLPTRGAGYPGTGGERGVPGCGHGLGTSALIADAGRIRAVSRWRPAPEGVGRLVAYALA